jgi:hypothetical protein
MSYKGDLFPVRHFHKRGNSTARKDCKKAATKIRRQAERRDPEGAPTRRYYRWWL